MRDYSWIGLAFILFVVLLAANQDNAVGVKTDWYGNDTLVAQRDGGNFKDGDGVTLTGVDDAGNNRVGITADLDDCAANEILKRNGGDTAWECAADATGAGGSAIALDIDDDGNNQSVDLTEIATTGDTNNIVTEDAADKMLIDMSVSWLRSDETLQTIIVVEKDSAGTINAGEVVYASGFDSGSGFPEVELAKADSAATMPAIGIAIESFTNSASGRIVMLGNNVTFNTTGMSVGNPLYVDAASAGTLTVTKPTGTNLIQRFGEVLKIGASGTIAVVGAGRSNDLPNLPDDNTWVGSSSGVPAEEAIADCDGGTNFMTYDTATNAFGCGAISDDFLANDGDIGTGVYDFGGADSFEIPNGANPTVDTQGQFAIDITDNQAIYFGTDTLFVLVAYKLPTVTIESPADADNFLLGKQRDSITITNIECIIDPADSGESVVITIEERDATADNPTAVEAAITCDNDGAADDGTIDNAVIDAGDWWSIDIGAVSGTVTQVSVSVYFTINRE